MSQKIDRRTFLQKTGLFSAAITSVGIGRKINKKVNRPNLVFVFSDQHRRQAMGFMHRDPVITPDFDKFSRESVVFTHAVSNRPVCSPFRAMLLTGRFPLSTGITTNCSPENPGLFLKPEEITISEVLKKAGYQTGYIGKWHLDDPTVRNRVLDYDPDNGRGWDTYTPPGPKRQGFDFWYAYNAYANHAHPHYWKNSPKMITVDEWSPEHEIDVAIRFIEKRKKDEPFALFISHLPPHPPYQVPEKYRNIYKDADPNQLLNRPNVKLQGKGKRAYKAVKEYFAAISGIDDQFGRLLAFLDEHNLRENTIVVFTADHGEMMGSHGLMAKKVWYEESIGIPFLLRWPGKVKTGRQDLLLGAMDIMPTLLGLMGLKIPATVEGTDYSWALCEESGEKPASTFICYYPVNTIQKKNLMSQGIDWRQFGYRGIRTNQYTFVVNRKKNGKLEKILYDNQNDPYQLKPQIDEAIGSTLLEKLEKELKRWLVKMNDPFSLK